MKLTREMVKKALQEQGYSPAEIIGYERSVIENVIRYIREGSCADSELQEIAGEVAESLSHPYRNYLK